ncbi:MAG TPA: aminomethyl-transferring glycine dehydrogenase subunit GcvPA [Anaerolineae bacterium]|nr:aminomethyl-transferring glycine dehydrogenase subunit GcvPA [Anaerolineae bacterium]HQI86520.1 aminomethyl-transferring glycine dehydrogenase subunit GcvPA [Anaerolineae bacterium]
MVYIPHTDVERREMLAAIGVNRLEDLFQDIPEKFRYPHLDLPEPLSEMEILQELQFLATLNLNANTTSTFLGAGAYRHWTPSVVDYVISRGEFYTAYTPYQAEVSQGTLQAIFEYESMICDLTGMEVANASHYDGATAAAEAVIQAYNVFRKKRAKIVIAPTVHPHYRQVIHTYTQGMELDIVGGDDPTTPLDQLVEMVDEQTACLIVQTPDFLGRLVNLEGVADQVHARGKGTLLAVVVNPISLGLLKPPGAYGADIALGEGQPLGLGLNFGGPYLGFYATQMQYARQMAGRLVGKTVDSAGQDGYVMTLTTREQHIRRDKATSNICSNEGLMALAATVYMAALGKHGLRQIAELNYHKAHYAASVIDELDGFTVIKNRPFFNEFVVRCPAPVGEINAFLRNDIEELEIIGGYDLALDYPRLENHMLVAVTEMNSRHEIDLFAEALGAFPVENGRSHR